MTDSVLSFESMPPCYKRWNIEGERVVILSVAGQSWQYLKWEKFIVVFTFHSPSFKYLVGSTGVSLPVLTQYTVNWVFVIVHTFLRHFQPTLLFPLGNPDVGREATWMS